MDGARYPSVATEASSRGGGLGLSSRPRTHSGAKPTISTATSGLVGVLAPASLIALQNIIGRRASLSRYRCRMPHYRAKISGPDLADVDEVLRAARVGVVTARDVESGTLASGAPSEDPHVESLMVSVDATDPADARSRLEEALPDGCSAEILGN